MDADFSAYVIRKEKEYLAVIREWVEMLAKQEPALRWWSASEKKLENDGMRRQ